MLGLGSESDIVIRTNYSFGKPEPVIRDSSTILPERIGRRGISSPIKSYFTVSNGGYTEQFDHFKQHEYDLYEYARIIDTESIAYKAFERKKALMFKNGYLIKSVNSDNISYIKQRLREFKYVSGISFEEFLEDLVYNLIIFHNAYCLFHRNDEKSTGNIRVSNDTEIKPIAAIFNFPTESIERVLNDDGTAIKYRQHIDHSRAKVFQARDVRHLSYNKRTGFTMGTPPLEPVKDDILALRRIEESVETLIYKSLFPIIHVKVGTADNPAQTLRNGVSEVSAMSSVLRDIDDSGGVVTSERVEIKAIGSESLALRVESYLNHFQERVMIGLGVSATDLGIGDSSGKGTGQIISQVLKEAVTDMQRVVSRFISEELFSELLIESGKYKFKYEIPEEDLVYLEFNNIDSDLQVKLESHLLNLMNSGAITYQEFRSETGRAPMTEKELKSIGKWQESRLPPYEVEIAKHSAYSATATTTTSTSTASAATGSQQTKSEGAAASSKSITSPSNQYTDSKIIDSLLLNRDDEILLSDNLKSHIESILDINNLYLDNSISNICLRYADMISMLSSDNIKDKIDSLLLDMYIEIGETCLTS